MPLAAGQRRLDHAAVGVEHTHGVRTPGFAHPRAGADGQLETGIPQGEVLRPMVKTAKRAGTGGHATTQPPAFLEKRDRVSGLTQGAGAGDAGHADTDDGNV